MQITATKNNFVVFIFLFFLIVNILFFVLFVYFVVFIFLFFLIVNILFFVLFV